MIGQKVLHYKVTEKLGEGGMGVVYKAEDTKLNRTVALKFLSNQAVGNSAEQERLVNEARAAAGLHHPNICTIYEINEFEGQTFIAMAYVDGVTLRDKVLSSTVGIGEALLVLRQVAEGLNQAHKNKLVHRDIKSANIMVDATGRTLIMDFGLAKQAAQAKPDEMFSSGGTSAYMSPEQARGEGVDQRTDIWSLGVVLYEMLAGQLPFRGDYVQAVLYSVLNEEPTALKLIRPEVSDEVAAIVEKCMKKDPASRYQDIDELISALNDVIKKREKGTAASGAARGKSLRRSKVISIPLAVVVVLIGFFFVHDFLSGGTAESDMRIPIAVIDFNNETDDPTLNGLSGMLITALDQSRRLTVMTRSRMFDLLKVMDREDIGTINESIGQELCLRAGVDALVIPTIRKFGNLYTIDLKVLDTKRNRYIFTTKEEGQGQESIPQMIDRIARNIRIDLDENTEAIRANSQSVADVTTVSLEAYQRYFEGEQMLSKLDFEGAQKAYKEAVEMDSTFALALYRLAYTQWWWHDKTGEGEQNVRKALALMERLPEREQFLAGALEAGLTKGFEAQTPIYREMQKRFPDDKEMLFGLGDSEFHVGNYDSAQVHFEQVLKFDPLFERALQHLTWTYLRTDQVEPALETAQKWVEVAASSESYQYLGVASHLAGDGEAALKYLETAWELASNKVEVSLQLAAAYLQAGDVDRAKSQLLWITEGDHPKKAKWQANLSLAMGLYPYVGKYELASSTLQKSIEQALAGEEPDSSVVVNGLVQRAMLRFYGWQDLEGIHEAMKSLQVIPEKYRDQEYWQNIAVLNIFAGDTASANRLLAEHKAPKITTLLFTVLAQTFAGECEVAQATLDTSFTDYKIAEYIPPEALKPFRYALAACQLEQGDQDRAIENLHQVIDMKNFSFKSALLYPKGLYLLGRAYEAKGENDLAMENYARLLDLWKDADKDLPELVDAKNRLAALETAASM